MEARLVGENLLAFYRAFDGVKVKSAKRPNNWRRDALQYYESIRDRCDRAWAHDVGGYCWKTLVSAAHIIPFSFLGRLENLSSDIFGSRGHELHTPSNCLLLSLPVKRWFDKYCLVIVPVDYNETPITRWKVEVIEDSIRKDDWYDPHTTVEDLDGRGLRFASEARPDSRFLYFHFIMALVRIRDIKAPYWKQVWARYFTRQLFPTPGNYLRQSMLLAINQHFQTTDARLIESWMRGQGFEQPITLSYEDAKRVANRIQAALKNARAGYDCEDDDDKYIGLVDLYRKGQDSDNETKGQQ
ncbi:hypothetical protein F5Y10DRAFT_290414 [Nemania abortiva]|nr:hypothetical protein F5Y10DRAFT_290414 [Nemania abortiva]